MTRTIAQLSFLMAGSAAFGLSITLAADDINSAIGMVLVIMACSAACSALFLIPLEWMLHLQIAAVLITAYIPVSVSIVGLNFRASQMLLPFVLFRLLTSSRGTRSNVPMGGFAVPAVVFWIALLAWTFLSLGDYDMPIALPLGRVFLHALNIAQAAAIGAMIVVTRHWRQAVMTLMIGVCILNGVLFVCVTGQSLGITALERFTVAEDAPQLSDGSVGRGAVDRFVVGVLTGCLSACVLVLALAALVLGEQGNRSTYLLLAAGAMVGMVIGFSRQAVLDVAVGLGIVGWLGFRKINWKRALGAAIAVPTIVVALLAASSTIPVIQPYWRSFAGRTLLLADLNAYSEGTVNDRLKMWSEMFHDIVSNPLIGRGQDAYLQYYPTRGEGSHNFPLEILHSAGVLGFAAYLWMHASVVRAGFQAARRSREELRAGVFAAVAIVILSSCSNLIFWNPAYWLILALGATAAYTGDGSPIEEPA